MTPARRREIHELLVSVADGDRTAVRAAFDALWPVLLAFASGALPVRQDAEDAAQRAILTVFGRIADLDRGRDAVAWALTVTSFEILTARKQRSRRREAAPEELVALAHPAPHPGEQAEAVDLRRALIATIGALGPRDQEALAELLRDEAPPRGEASRKRRFRAIERLRAAWRRIHG
jgi:DNA-directed RNA polymerase specialized sigma24 family protein